MKRHQSVEKVEGRRRRWRFLAAWRPSAAPLQRLCSACRRLRTEPQLPPWFGFGVDRCPKVAFHIWRPSCVKAEIKILMRSANLEKQLRHKHRGRLYLEMRWVRLAVLHSPAFNAQPTFLTAAVFSLLRFIFNAALHLFTWQARLFFFFLPPVSEPSIRHPSPAWWVCWVNQTGPVSTAGGSERTWVGRGAVAAGGLNSRGGNWMPVQPIHWNTYFLKTFIWFSCDDQTRQGLHLVQESVYNKTNVWIWN